MARITLLLLISFALSACSHPPSAPSIKGTPTLIPESFFKGPLSAHGIVKNRQGEVIRTFNAQLTGSWQDENGLLEERFVFNDGEIQYRNWKLASITSTQPTSQDKHYSGQAEDVIGPAAIQVAGNAMFIQYTLMIPYKGSTIHVDVDDRMYLVSDKVIINESKLTKWGIHIGK